MSERLDPKVFRKDGSLGFGEMGVPHFISSMQDILSQNLPFYVTAQSAYESVFSKAGPGTTEARIWSSLLGPNPDLMPDSEADKRARFLADEKSVILVNPLQFQYWIRDHPEIGCHLEFVRSYKSLFAYPTRKGFPYLKVMIGEMLVLHLFTCRKIISYDMRHYRVSITT